MTQQEIAEGNTLIAKSRFSDLKYKGTKNRFYRGLIGYKKESLCFHSSWDWLMPVVEKIEKIDFSDCCFNYNITGDEICISKYDDGSGIICKRVNIWGESKLSATFECVVEFIKWYNKNGK